MNTFKILAAIVTHNRKDLLARCIEHINCQSRIPDSIVVIDNASTDGTQAMLGKIGVRSIKQNNIGSAGGWKRCIQVALDEGFDAVWLMDDDGFPDINALKILERSLIPGISAVSSVVLNEDSINKFVFPFPILGKNNLPILFSFKRKIKELNELKSVSNGGSYPFAHFFNGALIPCTSIDKIGKIDDRYFIAGEEVDYFNRLSKIGEVRTILSAFHYHPDVSQRTWSKLKFYYFIKNTIIINHKIYKTPFFRDISVIIIALVRIFRRNGIRVFFLYVAGKNANIFYRAISRGYKRKIGKDFDG
jgi:rhamnopyranosyl-N-acetylglucosaminyl-diphospho-decaprenol beta-1,3/1,4-galactofuranosyltransferase